LRLLRQTSTLLFEVESAADEAKKVMRVEIEEVEAVQYLGCDH